MTDNEWIECAKQLPPDDTVVEVKVHDTHGCRNQQQVRRLRGWWFTPDGRCYVYFAPTHWREVVE